MVLQKPRQLRAFVTTCRNSPQTVNCVVADAVAIEPVSASNFPANREINREFCAFGKLRLRISGTQYACQINALRAISFANGTGNFWTHNRELQRAIAGP